MPQKSVSYRDIFITERLLNVYSLFLIYREMMSTDVDYSIYPSTWSVLTDNLKTKE